MICGNNIRDYDVVSDEVGSNNYNDWKSPDIRSIFQSNLYWN